MNSTVEFKNASQEIVATLEIAEIGDLLNFLTATDITLTARYDGDVKSIVDGSFHINLCG